MLYHDAVQNDIVKETPEMINDILQKREIKFYIGEYQAVGMVHSYDGVDYIVTAAAYDGYGYDNLTGLLKTLVVMFVIGVALLFVAGYVLARVSLRPIRNIVEAKLGDGEMHDFASTSDLPWAAEAETITASEIDRRLPVKNENDELGELSVTFNALLDRLECSFNSQKMFVSNVSHELRTPLAALTAELDVSLQKERTPEQYRTVMQNMQYDV